MNYMESGEEMKVLVCGGRNWVRYELIDDAVLRLKRACGEDLTIIQGEARGTDSMARAFCRKYNVNVVGFPANWDEYGRAAGPIRNKEMLAEGPDFVFAFLADPLKNKGTRNMIKQALDAGIPCFVFTPDNYTKEIDSVMALVRGLRDARIYKDRHPEEFKEG